MLDKKRKEQGQLLDSLVKANEVFLSMSPDERIDLLDWINDVWTEKANGIDEEQLREIIDSFKKGDVPDMTYAIGRLWDDVRAEGRTEGITEGEAKGRTEGKIESVIGMMAKFNLSLSEAMEAVNLPASLEGDIINRLNEQNISYYN
jgi:flagellar biosynthesis/type III secretory pathway protein FliH